MKNYYAILGLPKTATPAEIDAAFRSLAKKYHPDAWPEEDDAAAQIQIGDRGARGAFQRRKTPGVRPGPTPQATCAGVGRPFPHALCTVKAEREAAARVAGHRGGVASGARGGQPRPFGRNAHRCPRAMPFLRRTGWCGLPDVRGRGNGRRTSPCASATPARVGRSDSPSHPGLRSSSVPGWPQGRSLSSCASAAVLVTRQLERQPVLLDFPVQCPHA